MTRFELFVQELGRDPRVQPLSQTMVVGRSRRADLTIEDEEVGREQFRIGIDAGKPFLEGLGTTNQTIVDGSPIPAGSRRTLAVGSVIRVGRTTITLRNPQSTEDARPGGLMPDATMVAPRPPGQREGTQPPQERTGGASSPMRTMPPGGYRPGLGPEETAGGGQPRPGAAAASSTPPPGAEPEQTMQLRGGGYRPGQASPPPPDQPEQTIQVRGGPAYRPGQGTPPPPPPKTNPPPPANPDRTLAAPRSAPEAKAPPPAAPPPAAAPPAAPPPERAPRPTTLAVKPIDIAAELKPLEPGAAQAVDVEARLHESLPRLFVKCDGLKRRIRLMKARNMLGRAESVDVLLPNESVSEQHAEITFDGKVWMLRDRGSTNGSFVDGAHLRGGSAELQRHSIIALGNVRAIFLCNDRRDPPGQRRLEERAVRLLAQAGRLPAEAGREALRVARADQSQSIAELLLMDTPITPAEWATAITTARGQRGFLDVVKRLFERLRRDRRAPKKQ